MMRYISLILAAFASVVSGPALACRGLFAETYTFLPAPPEKLPADVVVLLVRPSGTDTDHTRGVLHTRRVLVERIVSGTWNHGQAEVVLDPVTTCSRGEFLVTPSYVVGTPSVIDGRFNAIQFTLGELRGVTLDGDTIKFAPIGK